jgi:hypothetical protein
LAYPLSEDSGLALFTTYERKEFNFERGVNDDPMPLNTDVHLLTVDTAIGTFFSDDVAACVVFEPSIASDLDQFNRKDVQFFFGPLASYRTSPDLAFQLGLFESTSVYDTYIYPIVGMTYRSPARDWRFNMALPSYARAGYFLTSDTELYTLLNYTYEEYHVRFEEQDLDTSIRTNSAHLGAGTAFNLTRSLRLNLEAGYALGTRYRGVTFDGSDFDGRFDPSLYVAASIGIRLY